MSQSDIISSSITKSPLVVIIHKLDLSLNLSTRTGFSFSYGFILFKLQEYIYLSCRMLT